MQKAGDQARHDPMMHKADPAYRRILLVWLLGSALVGACLLLGLHAWLRHLETTVGRTDVDLYYHWLSRTLAGVALMFAAASLAAGIRLQRLAAASLRDRRWPPLDFRSGSDIRIRYLTSADAFIGNLKLGAYGLFALAAALALWAAWLAQGR